MLYFTCKLSHVHLHVQNYSTYISMDSVMPFGSSENIDVKITLNRNSRNFRFQSISNFNVLCAKIFLQTRYTMKRSN